jgi:predicted Zn-dependent protease
MKTPSTLVLAFAFIISSSSAWCDPYAKLPDMGEAIDRDITTQEELIMGNGFMQALKRQAILIDNPLINHYIQSLGQRLASASGWQAYPFHFTVIKDDEINAFAAPGGYISIFSGLILRTENENELAGVMAHEMSHVTQRHIARMIVGKGSLDLTTLAAVAAALIIGAASGSRDAGMAAASVGMAGAMQQQINFTRENEYEADRIGIQIMADAQFDPSGMVSFFEKLARQESEGFYTHNELLRTHPVTTNRIAEATNRALMARPQKIINSPDYAYAKAALAAELNTQPLINNMSIGKFNLAVTRYYDALVLARAGQPQQAAEILGELYTKHPENLWIGVALADTQRQLKQDEAATQTLQKLLNYYPGHPILNLRLAQLWMDSDPERAYQLLRDTLRNYPQNEALLSGVAEAAARADRQLEHHEALGMYFMAQQRLHEAHSEFETARALTFPTAQNKETTVSGGDLIARQRIDALIKLTEEQLVAVRERKKEKGR